MLPPCSPLVPTSFVRRTLLMIRGDGWRAACTSRRRDRRRRRIRYVVRSGQLEIDFLRTHQRPKSFVGWVEAKDARYRKRLTERAVSLFVETKKRPGYLKIQSSVHPI